MSAKKLVTILEPKEEAPMPAFEDASGMGKAY